RHRLARGGRKSEPAASNSRPNPGRHLRLTHPTRPATLFGRGRAAAGTRIPLATQERPGCAALRKSSTVRYEARDAAGWRELRHSRLWAKARADVADDATAG